MSKSINQFILFLAGTSVCLYLAFSPAVNIKYINHDSIRYFHKFYNSGDQTDPLYGYLKNDGRPVAAVIEEFLYKHINHLSDVSRLRFMTIAIFALCSSMLIMFARSIGMETLPAFCLCVAIFTLPGVQDIVFVPYVFIALAVFLSLIANFILKNKLPLGLHYVFTFVLLETAYFMYPPVTFFFLVPATIMVIFHKNREILKNVWLKDVLIWTISALIYYFVLRMFYYTQIKSTGHEMALSWKMILILIKTFLPDGAPQVFNLWNIYYSKILGLSVMFFVAVFMVIDFFMTRKMGWGRLGALAAIFFIFNIVWFFFGGYMPRQFITAQALVLALVFWCGEVLAQIGKRKSGVFVQIWSAAILCFGLIITNHMVTTNALNNYAELMFVRSRLAKFVNSSTKEIHFISLKGASKGYNGLPVVYDNINSSIIDYEFPDLVRVALKDLDDPFKLNCIITYSRYGEPFSLLPDSVVIDMNDLAYIHP